MIKNIFITGKPGCGKTTLIKEILRELNLNVGGFYTQEIREMGIRKGFKIITLDDKEGILAHIDIRSPYKVSKYGVNLKDLEEIGVKSILDSLKENKLVIIDEVGGMEICSEKFKKTVIAALDSKNKVLGTIKMTPDPFTDKIRKRIDTKIFYLPRSKSTLQRGLTRENFEVVKKEIKEILT